MKPALLGLLTGAAFGVVLYKVGASRFSRVMGMLTFRDTKIMKFAFTAIATSSVVYGLASLFGVAEPLNLVPRVMPFLGPAHLVGGAIFGVAMGTTGTCPGTCVARAGGMGGEKKFTALFAMLGLVAGILIYSAVKAPLTDAGVIAVNQRPITLHGLLGLPYGAVALGWGALFFVISAVADKLMPERFYAPEKPRRSLLDYLRGEWTWQAAGVVGGLVIVAATMQKGYLGFSGAALALVGWVAHLLGHPLEVVPKINDDIVWRAMLLVGVFPGALLAKAFSTRSEAAAKAPLPKVLDGKELVKSFAGGTGLALGAMIGGGCTTGAFIAAWSTLSVGSLAQGGTFFAVGAATGQLMLLLKRVNLEKSQQLGDRVYD